MINLGRHNEIHPHLNTNLPLCYGGGRDESTSYIQATSYYPPYKPVVIVNLEDLQQVIKTAIIEALEERDEKAINRFERSLDMWTE